MGQAMRFPWERLAMKELLEVRISDLGLRLEGSWLEEPLTRVQDELVARDLTFRVHFWLADEWFSPDGVPGVAIPFFLAHPRLMRLERQMMFEVEGGTRGGCLKILRHELGHAIDNAYRLYRRPSYQATFGRARARYPQVYRPNPASKRFVQHLDGWYAQSHPAEDFAETFAVWLKSGSQWKTRYAGWPALKKLEYLDELMGKLAGQKPKEKTRQRPYSLSTLRYSLREYYEHKRAHYQAGYSEAHDRDLLRLFSSEPRYRRRPTAASFLRRHRREIRERVAHWTGEYEFALDQVLKQMIGRCRELKLRLAASESHSKNEFILLLAVNTVHYLHRGNEWHRM
jgi:hypothetical protein